MTTADELTVQMDVHGAKLYRVLHRKYPEFTWVEKYVLANQSHIVSELTGLYMGLKGQDFFWSYEADIELYTRFLLMEVPVISMIRLKSGTKHVVCVVGFSYHKLELYVNDPLGNYHTDYQEHNGAGVPFSYRLFQEIAVGNPLRLFCFASPKLRQKCRDLLRGRAHFEFTTEEVKARHRELGWRKPKSGATR